MRSKQPRIADAGRIAARLIAGGSIIALLSAQSPVYQAAVDRYKRALADLELHDPSRRGLEAAFQALAGIREALMQMRSGHTILEEVSDEEFDRLEHDLPGVLINRQETVFVEPDPDFFVQLAVGHGDAADRQFFSALKATYPESVWPAYIEQQTDYSGCTRFGSGKLVEAFRAWSRFQRTYPRRYVAAVHKELQAVVDEFTKPACACGDVNSVERETERLLRLLPASSFQTTIAERLQAVRSGHSDIRPNCQSG